MPGRKTLERHEALMTRMAQTVGTDLPEAELKGELPPEMRDDMILRCTGCTSPEDCQQFLTETKVAEAPPDYCRNGMMLLALRKT